MALNLTNKVFAKAHPETGAIITQGTKNPEWGSVRVETQALVNNGNGMITLQTRVAFVRMQMELGNTLATAGLLKTDKVFPVEGKIIVQESLEPFFEGQTPKINPQTQEEVLYMGTMPIYRQAVFVSNPNAHDELIADYVAKNEAVAVTTETVGADIPVGQEV